MTITSIRGRRLAVGALGLAILLGPVAVSVASGVTAPRVVAGCDEVTETTDSFSMSCVPQIIPDVSDQLTEAEVAMPGWNAVPGGGGGGGGGGGRR